MNGPGTKAKRRKKAAPGADEILAEALKQPGVSEVMEVYKAAMQVQAPLLPYLSAFRASQRVFFSSVATSASGS
jgi:hypothetical protein